MRSKLITFSEREQIHPHQLLDKGFRHDIRIRKSNRDDLACTILLKNDKTTRGNDPSQ